MSNRRKSFFNRKFQLVMVLMIATVVIFTSGAVWGKTVLNVGTVNATKSINPFVEYSAIYYASFGLNYDFLYDMGNGGKVIPNLATDVTRSDDGLTYTIKLRSDGVFLDGKPVTAEDVAFSFNYIMKNELGAFTQYTSPITGVKVLDDVTVEMKLSEPINRDWLEKNTFCWVPILPKHIWADISKEAAVGSIPIEKLFGSGPYTISEFEPDHFIRLTATEDGKKRFKPVFDEIIIKQYANDSAMLQDFKAGNIQLIHQVPAKSIPMVSKLENVTLKMFPPLWFDDVIFNSWETAYAKGLKKHPHPALKDVKIREALDWVLDENLAAKIAHGNFSVPGAGHMLPTGYGEYCNTKLDLRTYDIEKAKKILADAGYKDTDKDGVLETQDGLPLIFDVWIPSSLPYQVDVATIWAREAKKVGIKLNVSTMDGDTLWGKMSPSGSYDIALWRWGGESDPDYLFSVMTSANAVDGGWSDTGFTNAEFDKLYTQQRVAASVEERRNIIWKMQEILHREMPYLYINYWGDIGAVNSGAVKGSVDELDNPRGIMAKDFILGLEPKK